MKKLAFAGMLSLYLLSACQNQNKQQNHSHEGHNHNHTEQNHSATGTHKHENCDHDHDHEHSYEGHSHSHDSQNQEQESTDEIVISPEKAQAAGIKSQIIQPGIFNHIIKTSGQVLAAQGDEATAVATVAGIVSFQNRLLEGTSVSRGTPLLKVSARNLTDGDPALKARATFEKAKKEYERMHTLVQNKIVSEKDFNQAELDFENARISYEAVAKNHSAGGQSIPSPIGGYVKSIWVKEGDYVAVGQPLVSITQNRKLFLRAEVSEKYYSYLRNINSANFKTPYDNAVYQLGELNGRLLSFGKSSGDNSYYVPVTFEFDNKGEILPGTFVEIYLLSTPIHDVISLPHSALTEEQGSYFVYQQLDDECYKKQLVTLGGDNGESVQIINGIHKGDRIVTEGAYQVKLASASNVLPAHSHEH
ncbi:MAG: efflux RND transporter periplasmic adaptor subunit [Bacteroides sp.]|nr:efflux RND transporter periplasmic adaptor subunit [Bacteroides sp.]